MNEKIKQAPSIFLANVLFVLSLLFRSDILLYVSLLAWLVGLILLFIQSKESRSKRVIYAALAVIVVAIIIYCLCR